MAREPWSKEARGFIYNILSRGMAASETNQVALATKLSDEDRDRLWAAGIIEQQAGGTLCRFGEAFVMRAVATIMEKFLPGVKETAEARKSGRSRGPMHPSVFVLKQAAKTMRMKMDSEAMEDDQIVKELWPALRLTDEGFFLIPYLAIYESGKARSDFTAEERERYMVSLEPTGEV